MRWNPPKKHPSVCLWGQSVAQGEQSHYSNHPRAHTVKLGRMTTRKKIPHPWPHSQTGSYHAYQATQTPLFSNPLMLLFDTQVCHKREIYLRFHQILKVILEMAFSAHCTQVWKLNQISMTIISKVACKCIWYCYRGQWCVTVTYSGGKLCSGAWKRGQDKPRRHVLPMDVFFWVQSLICLHNCTQCKLIVSWLTVLLYLCLPSIFAILLHS